MKSPAIFAILIAGVVGAAVWVLSPWATGHAEPWDAQGYYYQAALVFGGILSGLVIPKPLWAHYLGSILGQFLYQLVFLELGPLIVIGAAFLLGYSLLFLGGALAGSRARTSWAGRRGAA